MRVERSLGRVERFLGSERQARKKAKSKAPRFQKPKAWATQFKSMSHPRLVKAGVPGLKLLRSHRELATIFGNCGPVGLRDRHHSGSLEREQPMRLGGCSSAQRSP